MKRIIPLVALIFCSTTLLAQSQLWKHVGPQYLPTRLESAELAPEQRAALINLFKSSKTLGGWDCETDDDELLKGLSFQKIPVAKDQNVVLVEAGAGCARGGQGANGAMWLVRLDSPRPVFLATPQDGFSGWLYTVQPTSSHGYRDIILGWHMSGREFGLSYFRFDGKTYRTVGTADAVFDDDEKLTITPNPARHR
jgi:hypothetical protein